MEDLYSIHPGISCAGEIADVASDGGGSDLNDLIKARIATHPRYPSLLSAYVDCRKVGAPPEMAALLEKIEREKYSTAAASGEMGVDRELDEFGVRAPPGDVTVGEMRVRLGELRPARSDSCREARRSAFEDIFGIEAASADIELLHLSPRFVVADVEDE